MHRYEELEVWLISYDLALDIWKDAGTFPRSELYGLTQQIRRSSYSVPANIAEGSKRVTVGEFRHSLGMAAGSNAETDVFLRFAKDLGLMDPMVAANRRKRVDRVDRMLTGLMLSLGPRPRKRRAKKGLKGKQAGSEPTRP
ncbi:MAG TPA: four helix bundle protein [Longimicrobiales bacterium]